MIALYEKTATPDRGRGLLCACRKSLFCKVSDFFDSLSPSAKRRGILLYSPSFSFTVSTAQAPSSIASAPVPQSRL